MFLVSYKRSSVLVVFEGHCKCKFNKIVNKFRLRNHEMPICMLHTICAFIFTGVIISFLWLNFAASYSFSGIFIIWLFAWSFNCIEKAEKTYTITTKSFRTFVIFLIMCHRWSIVQKENLSLHSQQLLLLKLL